MAYFGKEELWGLLIEVFGLRQQLSDTAQYW